MFKKQGESGSPLELYSGLKKVKLQNNTTREKFWSIWLLVEDIYQTCASLRHAGVTINRPLTGWFTWPLLNHLIIFRELLQGMLEPKKPWKSMWKILEVVVFTFTGLTTIAGPR